MSDESDDYERFRMELSSRTKYARWVARLSAQNVQEANDRARDRVCAKWGVRVEDDPFSERRFNELRAKLVSP